LKGLYSTKQGGRLFYNFLRETFEALGFTVCSCDEAVIYRHRSANDFVIVGAATDNLSIFAPADKMVDELILELKSMHGAHLIGKYWEHIPGCAPRITCHRCSETEDLEHILTRCSAPTWSIVWLLAEEVISKRLVIHMLLSFGTILGCGMIWVSPLRTPKHIAETNGRLFQIIASKSAYLIWLLRNEVVCGEKDPPNKATIQARW
jgi:hypothetical protein